MSASDDEVTGASDDADDIENERLFRILPDDPLRPLDSGTHVRLRSGGVKLFGIG